MDAPRNLLMPLSVAGLLLRRLVEVAEREAMYPCRRVEERERASGCWIHQVGLGRWSALLRALAHKAKSTGSQSPVARNPNRKSVDAGLLVPLQRFERFESCCSPGGSHRDHRDKEANLLAKCNTGSCCGLPLLVARFRCCETLRLPSKMRVASEPLQVEPSSVGFSTGYLLHPPRWRPLAACAHPFRAESYFLAAVPTGSFNRR
jgi:hypothetical protein